MAKTIHLPCSNKPLHTAECSECGQIESRVADIEEKLDTIQEGAEVNVQSDWDEDDVSSDAYIKNKPNITPITVDSQLDAYSANPVENGVITGALGTKQDSLVSGTNIKTINGNSLLGNGDITIQGGGDKNIFYADAYVTSSTAVKVDVYGVPAFSDDTLFYLFFVSDAFTPADNMTFNFYQKGQSTLLKSVTLYLWNVTSHEYPETSNIAFLYSDAYDKLFIDTVGMASTSEAGLVRLTDSTSSTSTTTAATPASVRSAYNLANSKQDALVSGTNIKTVNGNSLLGSGDVTISGGSTTTWYGTSSTGASTTAKSVTCSGFAKVKGAVISVTFTNPNTANAPTLNVNSTGASAIYKGNNVTSSSNPLHWGANETVTFMYDGTYYRYVSNSSDIVSDETVYWDYVGDYDVPVYYGEVLYSPAGLTEEFLTDNSLYGNGGTVLERSDIVTKTVPITVAAWDGGTTATVSVTGVTASNDVIVSPAPTMIEAYVASGVYCGSQSAGALEFECVTTPTTALLVHVMIVG